jgi:hypothetical protein
VEGRAEPLLRQEKLSELLEKLTVAREVARGQFLLHLAEQGARSFKRIAGRFSVGSSGCDTSHTDEETLRIRESTRPFDLAIVRQ